jgi:cleavage and polyadenylation specificity factor subunit 1
LLALQTKLETAVPHVAGLNPRTWRLFRPALSMKRRYSKNFLDGNLLGRYIHLDLGLQLQLASALHQSRDVLLGDLYELLVSTQIT